MRLLEILDSDDKNNKNIKTQFQNVTVGVPDPNPYVFVPPGSGSFNQQAKNEENLDFYCFVTSL
jgi:hypothetical protein